MKLNRYAKAILSAIGAAVTAVSVSAAGASTGQVALTAITAGLTAAGVLLVPNAKKPGQ